MGTLRLVLALSVVAGHGDFWRPFFFVTPPVAVISFFTVSGFYMALVIEKKYGDDWRTFMLNRVLRLYPAYAFFTVLYVAFLSYKGTLNTDPLALLLTMTLVGQDVLQCLVTTGELTRFGTNDIIHVIPIAQAWSVALELQLYLIAAFVFRTWRGVLGALVVGVLLKVLCASLGFTGHPLSIALVFNVLVFFALGGAGYVLYRQIDRMPTTAKLGASVLLGALILMDLYTTDGFYRTGTPAITVYAFYLLVASLAPFIFSLTKASALDRLLGDASYPVYLSHIMVFAWAAHFGLGRTFVLLATLAVSIIALLFIDRPIAAFRLRALHRSPRFESAPRQGPRESVWPESFRDGRRDPR